MRRNPELAHKVTQIPEIAELRHTAIDKITALSLASQILARATQNQIDPVEEIELEIRINELLDDCGYLFRKYIRAKVLKYEDELHKTLEKGSKMIQQHKKDLNELSQERGIQ